jgi:uncharacterized damage-inducible protein DinB
MFERYTTLRLLRRTAHDLAAEIAQAPAEAALWRPAEGEWSIHETLTHIRDVERQIFLPRLRRVASVDRPDLPSFDEVAYHREHWNPAEPLEQLLADFVADRSAEVALLEPVMDWGRVGLHPKRGPVTLAWLAEYALGHTWEHLAQIMRVRLAWETRRA